MSNKKLFTTFIFFLIYFNVLGQKDTIVKKYYENGNVSEVKEYKIGVSKEILKNYSTKLIDLAYNGEQDLIIFLDSIPYAFANGKFISYYENGTISMKGRYKNINIEGEKVYYDESGKISCLMNFKNGKRTDIKNYTKEGKLTLEMIEIPNKFQSTIYEYYENNQIKEIRNWKPPIQNIITFFENGKTRSISKYINDKADGESKSYYENGKLQNSDHYINGKKEGTSQYLDSMGNLILYCNYKNDKLEGAYKFYQNGRLSIVTNYKDGKKNGLEYILYPNGKLATSGAYLNNNLHGTSSFYSSTGKLIEVQIWNKGQRVSLKTFR
jgi:antitoxin component YwqK of YwqJK toxin-antitoxin module